jgi:hypothetical protein
MAYSPIAFIAPNYSDYGTYWLKAYLPGSTTPKLLAIESTGTPTFAKLQLNVDGFFKSAGGALIIPHVEGAYDGYLFQTEAEADANNTAGAVRLADNITPLVDGELRADLADGSADVLGLAKHLTLSQAKSSTTLVIGDALVISDRYNSIWDVVVTSSVTPDTYGIVISTALPLISFVVRNVGIMDVAAFGADTASSDTSNAIIAALTYSGSVAISNPYFAASLTSKSDRQKIYFFGAGKITNVAGQQTNAVVELTHTSCRIYNAVIDGNGATTGGTIATASYSGINLFGDDCQAISCEVYAVGQLLTSGDQGGTNQVGVGFGGFSSSPQRPVVFIDCLGHDNSNYGFNPRSNSKIIRGASWGNGTNGVGNRFCSNFHVDGHYIGVQYQGNAGTLSVGMTLDTESATSGDYQKLSKDCSFRNMIIEAQESFSISSSFYPAIFENIHAKGNVQIQSTSPAVAPDIGTTASVVLTNVVVDGTLKLLNLQKAVINNAISKSTAAQGFECDNIDLLIFNTIETNALDARLIRIDKLVGDGYIGISRLILEEIPDCQLMGLNLDSTTSVTDKIAITVNNVQGKLLGKISNFGVGINSNSTSIIDADGFKFEGLTASDGAIQNACVRFVGTTGWSLNNLKFKGCTNRTLFATSAVGFTCNNGNSDAATTGTFSIASSCDRFTFSGWTIQGACVISINAGTNMTGSEVNTNHITTAATLSAYPAGPTRFNGGVLQVWNGSAFVAA